MQKKLKGIVIAGATGVGKTDLSVKLAKQLNAVIISADASQVYKELNIGNFRLSRPEKGGTALMTIEIDQLPPEELMKDINQLPNVENAILIRAI